MGAGGRKERINQGTLCYETYVIVPSVVAWSSSPKPAIAVNMRKMPAEAVPAKAPSLRMEFKKY